MSELTEKEVFKDFNDVLFNVCEINAVASKYYDELVAEYYRSGEASAYVKLKYYVTLENEYQRNKQCTH